MRATRTPGNASQPRRRGVALWPLLPVVAAACAGADPAARAAVSEREALRRELAGLADLQAVVGRGLRPAADEALVVVRDSLVQSMLGAALPVTVRGAGRLEVTLERARVRFASNVAHVELEGVARHTGRPRLAAALLLRGALGTFAVDSGGVLRAAVALDDVTLRSPRGVPGALAPVALRALQNLTDRALPEIGRVLPDVTIPVRLDRELVLPAFSTGGALRVPSVRAPVRVAVEHVAAWEGRLWVLLSVDAGRFVRPGAARDVTAKAGS